MSELAGGPAVPPLPGLSRPPLPQLTCPECGNYFDTPMHELGCASGGDDVGLAILDAPDAEGDGWPTTVAVSDDTITDGGLSVPPISYGPRRPVLVGESLPLPVLGWLLVQGVAVSVALMLASDWLWPGWGMVARFGYGALTVSCTVAAGWLVARASGRVAGFSMVVGGAAVVFAVAPQAFPLAVAVSAVAVGVAGEWLKAHPGVPQMDKP